MPNQKKIPQGYKLTEVGMIPEDWAVLKLEEISNVFRGASPRPIDDPKWFDSNSTVGWLRISDVSSTEKYLYNTYQNLSEKGIKQSRFVQKDKLVMSICATVGKPILLKKDVCIHDGFVVFEQLKENTEYIYYMLQSIEQNWGKNGQTGSQTNLNTALIKATTIPITREAEEQTAIANALSDVDALIQSLKKLINKKQAIKTATMQQLLTGKKRLPEFAYKEDGTPKGTKQSELGLIPEDWEVVDFGTLFEPIIPKPQINRTEKVTFLGMQDVSSEAKIINKNILSFYEIRSGFTFFCKGDVLVAKITPCFENGKGAITSTIQTEYGFGSTEFHILRARENSDQKFVYYITITGKFRKSLALEMVGSAGHRRVSFRSIQQYRIAIPQNCTEQTAIAKNLSDMDEEIEALQTRLTKTECVKQGMMQELLTGKTRLVKPSKAFKPSTSSALNA